MIRFGMIGAALIALAAPSHAAEIYTRPTITHPVIVISDEIVPGDEQTFASVAAGLPSNSAVSLNSPGGDVPTAIAIGRMVRQHGFSTFVSNPPHYCNSACGLILMSGAHVVIEARAYVGFHAGNVPEATAMAAAYYRELGLTETQIGWMMSMPYGSIQYATQGRARALGFHWQTVLSAFGVSQCQTSGAHYCLAWP